VHCVEPAAGQLPLCSRTTQARFAVGPAEITSPFRQVVQPGHPVTLTWTASGNLWHVSAPTLGIAEWTSTPSFTIPAASVTAGVHTVTVVTCQWGVGCSNREDVRSSSAGTVHHLAAHQSIHWGGPVAEITPDGGGSPSPLPGTPGTYHHVAGEGAHVAAGELVGFVITGRGDSSQLVVGGPSADAFTSRSLAADFDLQRIETAGRSSIGAPLDVTYDSTGDVWSVGESSTGIAQVDGGTLTHHEAPYALVRNPTSGVLERTRPFGAVLGNGLGAPSGLTERVVDTGSAMWWIQGGTDGQDNHSRLIRLDRTISDDPATVADERMCAVHVPGDDNQVWGLAYDPATNRVWFSEQPSSGQAAVSWFIDGTVPCSNQLVYDRWEQQTVNGATTWVDVANREVVMAAGEANRCTATRTTNCIHRIALDGIGSPGPIVVEGHDLWIVSFTGSHLSRLPASATSAAELVRYPLPQPTRGSWFGGFPWQLRADAGAVYLVEFSDNQLLRLDRTRAAADAGGECTAATGPTRPANPCIAELTLPMGNDNIAAHSVALRDGRLWFTVGSLGRISPPTGDAAYLGYVDTASWAAGDPTGVIYPVAPLGPAPDRMHRSLGGIEVRADGQIAVAEYGGEILVLTPR
jgi:hypothetical protein